MKIIIPTYNRPETIRTHRLFPIEDVILVFSNEEQMHLYSKNAELHKVGAVAIANVTGNIAKKRQWILDNLVAEDEWIVMADDNIRSFRMIAEPWYGMDQLDEEGVKKEKDAIPLAAWNVMKESMAEADARGAKLVGFRTNSNPFFGRKKWNDVSYVSTKLCCIKKDSDIRFDPEFPLRDEVQFCAEHLIKFGRVLVNKYLYPAANHYEKGGIGSLDARLERRKEECRKLMLKYPGLFKYKKNHKSTPPESDLQLRMHSMDQIDNWRLELASRGLSVAHDPVPGIPEAAEKKDYYHVL